MVGVERFELPALWSQTRCATRLRYTPTVEVVYNRIALLRKRISKENAVNFISGLNIQL